MHFWTQNSEAQWKSNLMKCLLFQALSFKNGYSKAKNSNTHEFTLKLENWIFLVFLYRKHFHAENKLIFLTIQNLTNARYLVSTSLKETDFRWTPCKKAIPTSLRKTASLLVCKCSGKNMEIQKSSTNCSGWEQSPFSKSRGG